MAAATSGLVIITETDKSIIAVDNAENCACIIHIQGFLWTSSCISPPAILRSHIETSPIHIHLRVTVNIIIPLNNL